jgi:hypothetical protein
VDEWAVDCISDSGTESLKLFLLGLLAPAQLLRNVLQDFLRDIQIESLTVVEVIDNCKGVPIDE